VSFLPVLQQFKLTLYRPQIFASNRVSGPLLLPVRRCSLPDVQPVQAEKFPYHQGTTGIATCSWQDECREVKGLKYAGRARQRMAEVLTCTTLMLDAPREKHSESVKDGEIRRYTWVVVCYCDCGVV
jgi:hypothetical protein